MLIFLKHVTRISIYDIPIGQNNLVELLEVSTTNAVEVQQNRDIVNQYVSNNPGQMVRDLRNNKEALPCVSFIHQIKLRTPAYEENQAWRVVSGLFVDDQSSLVNLVEKMYKVEEKAVPWAGVAARLSIETSGIEANSSTKFHGKVFCFLPLHIQTRLPVHINGFFDLNSSRQALTTDHHTLTGKDAIRAEWNTQLVKVSIAQAYAKLITNLVEDVGRSDIEAFYEYWPGSGKDLPEALENLPASVYSYLQTAPVLHSADLENEWCNIQSLFFIPDAWQNQLQAPLVADSAPIPKPELPPHIKMGYESIGIKCLPITPAFMRNRLRVTEDIDKPIENAERPCLRQQKWIIALLKFCLSDKPSIDLVGVPLAILSDGHLHTFGQFKCKFAFLASDAERKIFVDFANWFVDPQFAEECELSPIPSAKLEQMTPRNVIANLNHILPLPNENGNTTWNPIASHFPNLAWLQQIYEYFNSHIVEIIQEETTLTKLPLVPDQFNRLWNLSMCSTPLIPPEDLPQDLYDALTKLGFPIVTGSPELVAVIRDFQKKVDGKFIWGFTGIDFVDTLVDFADEWQPQYPNYVPGLHSTLLDFLSTPAIIESLRQNEESVTKLKGLSIFPTTDGRLMSASEPELYLPANYDPPTEVGVLRLLSTGSDGRWKPLLRLMKIEELDRPTLIQKVLLPSYAELSSSVQVHVLEWIRDNLSLAETEQQKKNSAGNSKVVDCCQRPPNCLY